MTVIAFPSVADRLALTLDGLCRKVAARVAGGMMATWMILLVWQRVRRVERQILRLLERFRSGRLVVRVAGVTRSGGVRVRRSGAGLPRRFGWLLPLVPQEAAGFASQLGVLLDEPEMVGLLAASAQARRVLAPLCRMLGVSMPEAEAGGRQESSKCSFSEKKNQNTFKRLAGPPRRDAPSG